MNFEVLKTNIVYVPADAIVLPANKMLKEGSGASTAIFEAAGRKKLTKACEKTLKEMPPCEIGSAVPTLAYDLNANYIVHAIVPRWIDGNHNEYELLSSAYLSALNIADVMECKSIAFPLLASGNNGYDQELAFEIAKESIESFSGKNLEKVTLVVFGNRSTAIAKAEGYSVTDMPVDLNKLQQELANNNKKKKLAADGKETFQKYLDNGIQKAFDYLNDQKNIDAILKKGAEIVKAAVKKGAQQIMNNM